MLSILLSFVFTITSPSFQVGDSTPLKTKIYKVAIIKNGSNSSFGYLQGIGDFSIHLNVLQRPYGFSRFDKTFQYQEITKLSIHRKGSVGRGALLGGLGGTIVGGIAGGISHTPCTSCWDFGVGVAILTGATLGLLSGVLWGLVVGSTRKHRFKINGMKDNFEQMRAKLLRTYGAKGR